MSRKPLVIRPLKPKEQQTINRERLMAKEDFERGIAANLGAVQKAHWENQAEKAFAKRLTREGLEAAAKAHEEEVLARRRRLADLFNDEMESWHHEILSRVETTEDRKNKIRERAYALKARNEAARQAFVKECYDRRWRDACDDARLLDGKALLRFVADSRLSQIEEKKDRKEFMKKDEEQFFEAIKKHVQRLEAIEKEKEDRKERLKHETIATLEQQIKWSEERRKLHKERTAEEDEAEIEFIRQEIQKEQEKLEAKRRHAYEAGKQVRVFNEKRLGMRAAVKAEEKSQDQQLLDHALLKEQAEIAAEEAKKEKAKQESIAYQNYLKDLMIREKLDESATEDIRKKQENEVWEKRDEVQRKQKHARDYLMKQVMEGRQMQMALKKLANQEEAVLEEAQVSKWRGDIEQGLREDRAKVEARKKADQDNNAILLRQMEERRKRAQFEKQQEYLLYKHMRKEEEEHVRRQQEQAGRVRLHYPLVSSKWMS